MTLQSKMTVYAAIGGVFALMGGIVFYASLDNVDLDQVEIDLISVELRDSNTTNDQAKLDVTFLIKNPSDTTLTVSTIDYQLYGNGVLLGSGLYSTADIALPGRALFHSGAEVPLKNIFILSKSDVSSEIYEDVVSGKITSFTAEGRIITQTSWSEAEKEFKSGY
jgi:LEA14-like dessication related protein